MLDPKKQQEIDQSAAFIGEQLPPVWKRIYDNCVAQGFSEVDSLQLVKTYMIASYGTFHVVK